jgi:hypothetical protein
VSELESWPPGQWVFTGGGSGVNGRPTADPEVLVILRRHSSWDDALVELVGTGASDDEILAGGWLAEFSFEGRRDIEAKLRAARGAVPRGTGEPTVYATTMIPKIGEAYRFLARSAKRRTPSMAAIARKAEVDRDTIAGWVKRGWMTWPPV